MADYVKVVERDTAKVWLKVAQIGAKGQERQFVELRLGGDHQGACRYELLSPKEARQVAVALIQVAEEATKGAEP